MSAEMRRSGFTVGFVLLSLLATGPVVSVNCAAADTAGGSGLLAELPQAPSWIPGTIRRDESGRPVIEPNRATEPPVNAADKTEEAPAAKQPSQRKPAPVTKKDANKGRVENYGIAEAVPGAMQFAVKQVEMPALARIAADLVPGEWYEIPSTQISKVLATRAMAPENGGINGPKSVILSWNGATFDGRYWYFHGGGHRDYSGNEVYAFDFVDLSWDRITEPSPFVYHNPETGKWEGPKTNKNPCPRVADLNGDGKFDAPVPGHTYDGIVYSPKTESIFMWSQVPFCIGGSGWSGAPIWEFNPKTRSWSSYNPDRSKELGGYKSAELDPSTGDIIVVARNRSAVFDVERKEFAAMSNDNATKGSDGTITIDPVNRLFFFSDRSGVQSARLGDGVRIGRLGSLIKRPAFNQTAGGAFNSRDGNIVFWSGDRRIFTLDPVTLDWVLYENAEGPAPKKNRPYSKFIYLEALDLFAAYATPGDGIWLYRLPKEKPTENPERVVQVCHGKNCQNFKRLGRAFKAAKDGAVITIGAATFYEAAVLTANDVTVRGAEGTHLFQVAAEGKASLVIKGNDTVIEGIECSSINVSDGNGACVRLEGDNLTLRKVYFHDSQQGLLTKSSGGGSILIEDSKFERLGGACGVKCGRAHGIYIGKATQLTVRNSTFLSPKDEGHAIKSRAARTTIEDNVIASLDGVDSRLIDIPNGGEVVIRNNILQEGSNSSNPDIIGIGLELAYEQTPGHAVNNSEIVGNTVVIEPAEKPRSFVHSRDVPEPVITGNTLIGGSKPNGKNNWFKNREAAGLPPYPALPGRE